MWFRELPLSLSLEYRDYCPLKADTVLGTASSIPLRGAWEREAAAMAATEQLDGPAVDAAAWKHHFHDTQRIQAYKRGAAASAVGAQNKPLEVRLHRQRVRLDLSRSVFGYGNRTGAARAGAAVADLEVLLGVACTLGQDCNGGDGGAANGGAALLMEAVQKKKAKVLEALMKKQAGAVAKVAEEGPLHKRDQQFVKYVMPGDSPQLARTIHRLQLHFSRRALERSADRGSGSQAGQMRVGMTDLGHVLLHAVRKLRVEGVLKGTREKRGAEEDLAKAIRVRKDEMEAILRDTGLVKHPTHSTRSTNQTAPSGCLLPVEIGVLLRRIDLNDDDSIGPAEFASFCTDAGRNLHSAGQGGGHDGLERFVQSYDGKPMVQLAGYVRSRLLAISRLIPYLGHRPAFRQLADGIAHRHHQRNHRPREYRRRWAAKHPDSDDDDNDDGGAIPVEVLCGHLHKVLLPKLARLRAEARPENDGDDEGSELLLLSPNQARLLCESMDTDKDGWVSYAEFTAFVTKRRWLHKRRCDRFLRDLDSPAMRQAVSAVRAYVRRLGSLSAAAMSLVGAHERAARAARTKRSQRVRGAGRNGGSDEDDGNRMADELSYARAFVALLEGGNWPNAQSHTQKKPFEKHPLRQERSGGGGRNEGGGVVSSEVLASALRHVGMLGRRKKQSGEDGDGGNRNGLSREQLHELVAVLCGTSCSSSMHQPLHEDDDVARDPTKETRLRYSRGYAMSFDDFTAFVASRGSTWLEEQRSDRFFQREDPLVVKKEFGKLREGINRTAGYALVWADLSVHVAEMTETRQAYLGMWAMEPIPLHLFKRRVQRRVAADGVLNSLSDAEWGQLLCEIDSSWRHRQRDIASGHLADQKRRDKRVKQALARAASRSKGKKKRTKKNKEGRRRKGSGSDSDSGKSSDSDKSSDNDSEEAGEHSGPEEVSGDAAVSFDEFLIIAEDCKAWLARVRKDQYVHDGDSTRFKRGVREIRRVFRQLAMGKLKGRRKKSKRKSSRRRRGSEEYDDDDDDDDNGRRKGRGRRKKKGASNEEGDSGDEGGRKKRPQRVDWRKAWEALDQDGDGKMSLMEFQDELWELGDVRDLMSPRDMQLLLERVDYNGGKSISITEFHEFCIGGGRLLQSVFDDAVDELARYFDSKRNELPVHLPRCDAATNAMSDGTAMCTRNTPHSKPWQRRNRDPGRSSAGVCSCAHGVGRGGHGVGCKAATAAWEIIRACYGVPYLLFREQRQQNKYARRLRTAARVQEKRRTATSKRANGPRSDSDESHSSDESSTAEAKEEAKEESTQAEDKAEERNREQLLYIGYAEQLPSMEPIAQAFDRQLGGIGSEGRGGDGDRSGGRRWLVRMLQRMDADDDGAIGFADYVAFAMSGPRLMDGEFGPAVAELKAAVTQYCEGPIVHGVDYGRAWRAVDRGGKGYVSIHDVAHHLLPHAQRRHRATSSGVGKNESKAAEKEEDEDEEDEENMKRWWEWQKDDDDDSRGGAVSARVGEGAGLTTSDFTELLQRLDSKGGPEGAVSWDDFIDLVAGAPALQSKGYNAPVLAVIQWARGQAVPMSQRERDALTRSQKRQTRRTRRFKTCRRQRWQSGAYSCLYEGYVQRLAGGREEATSSDEGEGGAFSESEDDEGSVRGRGYGHTGQGENSKVDEDSKIDDSDGEEEEEECPLAFGRLFDELNKTNGNKYASVRRVHLLLEQMLQAESRAMHEYQNYGAASSSDDDDAASAGDKVGKLVGWGQDVDTAAARLAMEGGYLALVLPRGRGGLGAAMSGEAWETQGAKGKRWVPTSRAELDVMVEQLPRLVRRADANGDGQVDIGELVRLLTSAPPSQAPPELWAWVGRRKTALQKEASTAANEREQLGLGEDNNGQLVKAKPRGRHGGGYGMGVDGGDIREIKSPWARHQGVHGLHVVNDAVGQAQVLRELRGFALAHGATVSVRYRRKEARRALLINRQKARSEHTLKHARAMAAGVVEGATRENDLEAKAAMTTALALKGDDASSATRTAALLGAAASSAVDDDEDNDEDEIGLLAATAMGAGRGLGLGLGLSRGLEEGHINYSKSYRRFGGRLGETRVVEDDGPRGSGGRDTGGGNARWPVAPFGLREMIPILHSQHDSVTPQLSHTGLCHLLEGLDRDGTGTIDLEDYVRFASKGLVLIAEEGAYASDSSGGGGSDSDSGAEEAEERRMRGMRIEENLSRQTPVVRRFGKGKVQGEEGPVQHVEPMVRQPGAVRMTASRLAGVRLHRQLQQETEEVEIKRDDSPTSMVLLLAKREREKEGREQAAKEVGSSKKGGWGKLQKSVEKMVDSQAVELFDGPNPTYAALKQQHEHVTAAKSAHARGEELAVREVVQEGEEELTACWVATRNGHHGHNGQGSAGGGAGETGCPRDFIASLTPGAALAPASALSATKSATHPMAGGQRESERRVLQLTAPTAARGIKPSSGRRNLRAGLLEGRAAVVQHKTWLEDGEGMSWAQEQKQQDTDIASLHDEWLDREKQYWEAIYSEQQEQAYSASVAAGMDTEPHSVKARVFDWYVRALAKNAKSAEATAGATPAAGPCPLLAPLIVHVEHYCMQQLFGMQSLVVELGCGTSRMADELAAKGFTRIVAVDHSEVLIKQLSSSGNGGGSRVKYMCADARNLSRPLLLPAFEQKGRRMVMVDTSLPKPQDISLEESQSLDANAHRSDGDSKVMRWQREAPGTDMRGGLGDGQVEMVFCKAMLDFIAGEHSNEFFLRGEGKAGGSEGKYASDDGSDMDGNDDDDDDDGASCYGNERKLVQVLREVHRILRPGGLLVFVTCRSWPRSHSLQWWRWNQVRRLLQTKGPAGADARGCSLSCFEPVRAHGLGAIRGTRREHGHTLELHVWRKCGTPLQLRRLENWRVAMEAEGEEREREGHETTRMGDEERLSQEYEQRVRRLAQRQQWEEKQLMKTEESRSRLVYYQQRVRQQRTEEAEQRKLREEAERIIMHAEGALSIAMRIEWRREGELKQMQDEETAMRKWTREEARRQRKEKRKAKEEKEKTEKEGGEGDEGSEDSTKQSPTKRELFKEVALSEGEVVEGRHSGQGKWFGAKVGAARDDGSFDLTYDDGDKEKKGK
jgi:Ca2+-binding EF-hand superfamily protein/SAM-dependent methyltransferase